MKSDINLELTKLEQAHQAIEKAFETVPPILFEWWSGEYSVGDELTDAEIVDLRINMKDEVSAYTDDQLETLFRYVAMFRLRDAATLHLIIAAEEIVEVAE